MCLAIFNYLLFGAVFVAGYAATSQVLGEKPRVVPLATPAGGYSENASVTLLCALSAGHHDSLTFDWFKDGATVDASNSPSQVDPSNAVKIDLNSDHSLLRIARVKLSHAGQYTCVARNQFGQDSSSSSLVVNGGLTGQQ